MSEVNTDVCDICGGEIHLGDWPFCGGDPSKHVRAESFGDDPMEPYVDIQLLDRKDPRCDSEGPFGTRGVRITSRGQRRQLMRELGLQYGSQRFEERGRKFVF